MNKLKESILNEAINGGSRDTSNGRNNATNATTNSSDKFIYKITTH